MSKRFCITKALPCARENIVFSSTRGRRLFITMSSLRLFTTGHLDPHRDEFAPHSTLGANSRPRHPLESPPFVAEELKSISLSSRPCRRNSRRLSWTDQSPASLDSPSWSELSPGLAKIRALHLDAGGGKADPTGLTQAERDQVYRERKLREVAKMRTRCDSLNRSRVASEEDMYRARKGSRDMLGPGHHGHVPSRGPNPNATWAEANRVSPRLPTAASPLL